MFILETKKKICTVKCKIMPLTLKHHDNNRPVVTAKMMKGFYLNM